MKAIFCLLTGLCDRTLRDLGGLTPLQKAKTENLDLLCAHSEIWALKSPEAGRREDSLMALLGGESTNTRIPLAPLELYAAGGKLKEEEVTYCLRFISIGEGVVIDVSDALTNESECRVLCAELNQSLGPKGFRFQHLGASRALLIGSASTLHEHLSEPTINPIQCLGRKWRELPSYKGEEEWQSLLEEVATHLSLHEINELRLDLEEDPINAILPFEGGKKPDLEIGLKGWAPEQILVYPSSHSIRGLSRLLKINTWELGLEKKKYAHIDHILENLDEQLSKHDLIILDLPYLWASTYKGDLLEKVKSIEWLDRNFIGLLNKYCARNDITLVLNPLMPTDIHEGDVQSGEVPAMVFNGFKEEYTPRSFDERILASADYRMDLNIFTDAVAGLFAQNRV
ncbi:MAG: hypothetical protein CMO81_07995 [Waddliaceae bacterium]|nr:hypothetical protein [Waddliaceae bacterium]